jgi:hypothetical protein
MSAKFLRPGTAKLQGRLLSRPRTIPDYCEFDNTALSLVTSWLGARATHLQAVAPATVNPYQDP